MLKYIIFLSLAMLMACNSVKKEANADADYSISTSSESEERVRNVLPLKGKEDVSHLLKLDAGLDSFLALPPEKEYYANERYDWILTLEASEGSYFQKDSVSKYFNNQWRAKHQYPWVYCLPKGESNWTYFVSIENESTEFKKVALGWKLFDVADDSSVVYSERALIANRNEVQRIAKQMNTMPLSENYSPREAAVKSQQLSLLVPANNVYSIIVLKADTKFDGKEIWDVMMSLGLRWGDMDLFHWNAENDFGDEQRMSVWTSTEPGYFFPEEIAAGEVETQDLVFGFNVPRSVAPKQVLESMYNAVKYAQGRLGGRILHEDGTVFDIGAERQKIDGVLTNLRTMSVRPGSDDALYLFQ